MLALAILLHLQPALASGAGTVRVLTLNVFAGAREMDFERLERQIKAVKKTQADIICLQEIYDRRVRAAYQREFGDFAYLGYDYSTSASLVPGWLSQKAFTEGERELLFGLETDSAMLLSKSRGQNVPASKSARTLPNASPSWWSSPTNLGISMLEWLKPKGYVFGTYEIDETYVIVANMRLTNGVHNPERLRQVKRVVTGLNRGRGTDLKAPVILCGDTNSDADEPDMTWLRENAGYHDSFLEANSDPEATPHRGKTWSADNELTRGGNLSEPDQRVDYVLYLPGDLHTFRTLSSRIVFDEPPFLSDHFGVLTELELVAR